ncbi:MAG TPA: LysM peptidoglycan-binding domain-containing protein [Chthoniobacteraceae bacterium]|nr:LysM peptidoglycan-binding domain-containing protein [Chthoniobacteraceae bacterium]
MSRYFRFLPVLAAGSFFVGSSSADAQDTAGWITELRELRNTVHVQGKQIEALTQQVSRLAAALEGKPSPSATSANPPSAPAPNTAEEFAPTAPAASADPGPPKHVVMKGETLTSIAKHYNIALPELLKANKDINERKLQIGQSILLPPNVQPKNPEPTTTEKAQP